MKLLRSLLRITATVCICLAIIAIVTIVVRPQVLRDWPGDYAADPVVQLTGNFTPIKLARNSSGTLPVVQSAPADASFARPSDSANSGSVLAESQPDPVEAPAAESTSSESRPDDSESLDILIPARPTGEEYDSKNDAPAADPDVRLVPESYTIRAEPQGRVRIEGENGSSLEASEITLENASPHGDSNRPSAVSENAGDHTLPEFLRGRELPPLVPGQKVVTVHVPVDNWVDLSAGDLVDVRSEQLVGFGGDARVRETNHIDELERVAIYALPGIAPEDSDNVPVCLKVNPAQARLLIKLRASKTPVRLMVVKSAHAAADAYRDASPTPTATRVPLRSEDDFADPTPVRTPDSNGDEFRLPEEAPTAVVDPSVPVRNDTDDEFAPPTANRSTQVPQAGLPADEPTPIATAEQEPAPAARLAAESLPAIEPSEEGTVVPLDGKPLSLTVESAQIVESELTIQRVSGFDPKVIRITPLTPQRLKIEALAPGRTSLRVEPAGRQEAMMLAPFRVEVHVFGNEVNVIGKQVGELDLDLTYSPKAGENRPATIAQQGAADSRDQERKEAEATLRKLYPKASLEFIWLRDSLVLRGWVENGDDIPQIMQIAELFAPKVFNQLTVKSEAKKSSRAIPPGKRVLAFEPLNPEVIAELRRGVMVNLLRPAPRDKPGYALPETVAENIEIFDSPLPGSTGVALLVTPEQIEVIRKGKLLIKPVAFEMDVAGTRPSTGANLRDDIRALHADVRKLITLLEKRAAVTPPEHGGPLPQTNDNAAVVGQDIAQFPDRVWTRIGLKFTPVSPETAVEGSRSQRAGLRIDDVRADSPAALAGIQAGDLLVGADRYEINTAENLQYALNQTLSRGVRTLEFAIKRQSVELKASVELESVQLQPSPGTTIGPAVFSKP